MEQNTAEKSTKSTPKKVESSAIRFDKAFMSKLRKVVNKANKKKYGKKIQPKTIISNLFELANDSLIEQVISKSQEQSMRLKDKKDQLLTNISSKAGNSLEALEMEAMELLKAKYAEKGIVL